jgi:hypothetical protein
MGGLDGAPPQTPQSGPQPRLRSRMARWVQLDRFQPGRLRPRRAHYGPRTKPSRCLPVGEGAALAQAGTRVSRSNHMQTGDACRRARSLQPKRQQVGSVTASFGGDNRPSEAVTSPVGSVPVPSILPCVRPDGLGTHPGGLGRSPIETGARMPSQRSYLRRLAHQATLSPQIALPKRPCRAGLEIGFMRVVERVAHLVGRASGGFRGSGRHLCENRARARARARKRPFHAESRMEAGTSTPGG